MSAISFFALLGDSPDASAIGAAQSRADSAMEVAQGQGDAFGSAIARLDRRATSQDREIKLLRAAVGVLAAMLRDNCIVDGDMLDIRLEAALTNAEEEIEVAANTVTCPNCKRQVDRRITVMTESGIVCDRCHAVGG